MCHWGYGCSILFSLSPTWRFLICVCNLFTGRSLYRLNHTMAYPTIAVPAVADSLLLLPDRAGDCRSPISRNLLHHSFPVPYKCVPHSCEQNCWTVRSNRKSKMLQAWNFICCAACFLHPRRAKEMATLQGVGNARFYTNGQYEAPDLSVPRSADKNVKNRVSAPEEAVRSKQGMRLSIPGI